MIIFKRLIILLLFSLSQPILADFDYAQSLCKDYRWEYEKCNQIKGKYWWGDKLSEVDAKVAELEEVLRYAAINNNYANIEQYLQFPIEFYIEDARGVDTWAQAKGYTWTANNFKEFVRLFKKTIKMDGYSLEGIKEEKAYKTYYGNATVTLQWFLRVNIDIKCNKFKPTVKRKYPFLPEELHLCENIDAKIKYIATTIIDHKG